MTPWSQHEEVPANEGFPDYSEEPRYDEPSPAHRCRDIKKAKRHIHSLIKKEISEGNYYKGCPKKSEIGSNMKKLHKVAVSQAAERVE